MRFRGDNTQHIAFFAAMAGLLISLVPMPAHADILGAAREGDAEAVAAALETEDADPSTLGRPLHFASQRGHTDVVALLLDAGADPNTTFTFGSPLHSAARADHAEIVTLLLEHGADPNLAAGDFQQSPLHEAADRGSLAAARALLDNGADVNFRNDRGRPAIHEAVASGQTEMAAFLREAGAGPDLPEPITEDELASADIEAGRIALIGCNICHQTGSDQPATGVHVGPSLIGIYGAEQAAEADYLYSEPMQALDGVWTAEALNQFLADPTGLVPGTEMLRVPDMTRDERVGLIAYLRAAGE